MGAVRGAHGCNHRIRTLALQIVKALVAEQGRHRVHQDRDVGRGACAHQFGDDGLRTIGQCRRNIDGFCGAAVCLVDGHTGQQIALGVVQPQGVAVLHIAGHAHIKGGGVVAGDVVGAGIAGVRARLQINARPHAVQFDLGDGGQRAQADVVRGRGVHIDGAVGVGAAAEGDAAQRRLQVGGGAGVGQRQGLVADVPHAGDVATIGEVELVSSPGVHQFEGQDLHRAVQVLQLRRREQGGGRIAAPVVFSLGGQVQHFGRVVGRRHADGGGGHRAAQFAIAHGNAEHARGGVGAVAQVGESQGVEQGFVGRNAGLRAGLAEHHQCVGAVAGDGVAKSHGIDRDCAAAAEHQVDHLVACDEAVSGIDPT